MRWTCKLCDTPGEPKRTEEMMEHFEQFHPEQLAQARVRAGRWPDGQQVVIPDDIKPEDITGDEG